LRGKCRVKPPGRPAKNAGRRSHAHSPGRKLATPARRILVLALLVPAGFLAALPGTASDPAKPADTLATIAVPPGFVVERVAGPPLVEHPYMACFDERGRLYVCDAEGVNLDAPHLLKDPPNRIRLLEDTDGDGHFDRGNVFADRMTFPMGVLPHGGAVYSASPPSLWRLTD
jgi:hypothetical protein